MAYEFRKLGEVDAVETATDEANVLIEEEGSVKRVPKSEVGFKLPEGGTAGQVLAKTEEGEEWTNLPEAPEVAQADWSVNDESDPAYVRGRTHWCERNTEVVLTETTVETEFSSTYNRPYAAIDAPHVDRSAKSCTIVFDGVPYEYDNEYIAYHGGARFGNLALHDSCVSDTGEPFYLDLYTGYVLTETAGEHTLSIEALIDETYHPLDEKYIPDTVATKEYVDEKGGSAKIDCVNVDNLSVDDMIEYAKNLKDFWLFDFGTSGAKVVRTHSYQTYRSETICDCSSVISYYLKVVLRNSEAGFYSFDITEAQYNEILEAWAALAGASA